jgi:isoamylase
MNSHNETVDFVLPTLPAGSAWVRMLDTTEPELRPRSQSLPMGATFPVAGRALIVFAIPAPAAGENTP